jgi:NADPH-dependent ferric siderophore reductase
MPKSPAAFNNIIESLMGRTAHVVDVSAPASGLIEITLQSPPPSGGWQPGHEIQFRVTPTLSRRYTVNAVHGPDGDEISILVATDADGPGTRWIRELRVGAAVPVLCGRHHALREVGYQRLYLGDSSALGTLDAYAARSRVAVVALEVHPAAVAQLSERWPHYCFLPATRQPGEALNAWLELSHHEGALTHLDGALLLGHAQSIQQQRKILVDGLALPRQTITTRPYWADGKHGL